MGVPSVRHTVKVTLIEPPETAPQCCGSHDGHVPYATYNLEPNELAEGYYVREYAVCPEHLWPMVATLLDGGRTPR